MSLDHCSEVCRIFLFLLSKTPYPPPNTKAPPCPLPFVCGKVKVSQASLSHKEWAQKFMIRTIESQNFSGSEAHSWVDGKESACNAKGLGLITGSEDSLEKGMVNYYIIVAWRIPWIEEPGRLQSIGSQRVRQDWLTVTATRGEQLIAWWPACSHDLSCSIMSSPESVIKTIRRTGLKRMRLTLLLTIIYIFVGIKIIAAFSTLICKWATKIVSKRCYRPMLISSMLRIQLHMSVWRSYRWWILTLNHVEMEWWWTIGNWKQLFCPLTVFSFLFSNLIKT